MDYLRDYLGYIHKNAAGMSGMTLLAYYSQQWDYFSQSAKVLNNVFNSINRRKLPMVLKMCELR